MHVTVNYVYVVVWIAGINYAVITMGRGRYVTTANAADLKIPVNVSDLNSMHEK